MTCQNFMLIRELWGVAMSHPWPSDGDLAYTMTSATFKSIEKKLSEPNWMLESRERSQNDKQSYKFVR